ncbi:hypothetical protein PM3016_251 [Paenibacillus mucilaginosus 3016]|uniref:Uncharacterized protein n=1 Tax=Paenibacillus mucilaginosus 3016 TaxID=1116391 RepID=H6NQR7_9BACL|nr:hypothetical protein PM3016_251 [Paenibacillus mucilaginosus 3016]
MKRARPLGAVLFWRPALLSSLQILHYGCRTS